MKNSSFRNRVGFAVNGVRTCWRSEANFRIQMVIGLVAILAMIVLRPAPQWWALVGLVITLVLASS